MGAWGTGIFENDTALDWVWDLEDAEDALALIEDTLERVAGDGLDYLEAPDAEEALAAAQVVAMLQGNPGDLGAYSEELEEWVQTHPMAVPRVLAHKARAAVVRILAPQSELAELWEESEEAGEWKACVQDLQSRIVEADA
jgi:hypothetical protein